METVRQPLENNSLKILVAGNNPIEVRQILEKLYGIGVFKIVTEFAFDLRSALDRLIHFRPDFIFIDDNLEKNQLNETIHRLSTGRETKNIPVAILKNSNYKESSISSTVSDYILKQNLSSDSLYSVLKNGLKFRRTQRYFYDVYRQRKSRQQT